MGRNTPLVLYLSHGGGPLPLLGDEGHLEMVYTLEYLAAKLSKPSAILLVSAHWEEDVPTITSGPNPELIYDYYGFPAEAYSIEYPCAGETELAGRVHQLLDQHGIEARLDGQRGFDHGLFVPLKIMYPEADIPCVQLSLVTDLDPLEHLRIGSALASLDQKDLLVIGSGFSFHNMRAFFSPETEETRKMNKSFERWLIDTCANSEISEEERWKRLAGWEEAPFARYCHPREEHLLPLHVCYGIAQRLCREYFELKILGKKASFYLW